MFVGSFAERSGRSDWVYNCLFVINFVGEIVGVYWKIYLFDIDMDEGFCFFESNFVMLGEQLVVVECLLGWVGLSVCYDLCFPSLFESL